MRCATNVRLIWNIGVMDRCYNMWGEGGEGDNLVAIGFNLVAKFICKKTSSYEGIF